MTKSKYEVNYRRYLNLSLDQITLMNFNKTLPEGQKYCNAFCQSVRNKETEWTGARSFCKFCLSTINLVGKLIEQKKFTLDQFKADNSIIQQYTKQIDFTQVRRCTICDEEKTLNNFENTRTQCKACRLNQVTEDEKKDNENVIEDCERVKHNKELLVRYLLNITKKQLCFICKHYKVGRLSTDYRDTICDNIIKFFTTTIEPKYCQGGCGFELPKNLSICKKCKEQKYEKNKIEKSANFQKNLASIAKHLESLDGNTTYNSEELKKLCYYFKIDIKGRGKKAYYIEMLNKYLEEKKNKEESSEESEDEEEEEDDEDDEDKFEDSENKEEIEYTDDEKKDTTIISGNKKNSVILQEQTQNIMKFTLKLQNNTDISISVRRDGYVNGTQLCNANNKSFYDYERLQQTQKYLNALVSKIGVPLEELIISKHGGDTKSGIPDLMNGTWVHRKVALHLAQWVSPLFAVQVSEWLDELLITGSVELGKEKSDDEIMKKFKKTIKENKKLQQQITDKEKEVKEWNKKYNRMLLKRRQHELKYGPGIYVYSTDDGKYHKIGKEEANSVNTRLRQHRTSYPRFRLEYVVYTKDAGLLETLMLKRYTKRKTFQNHEELEEVDLDIIIKDIQMIINMFNIEATIESEEEIDKYNESALIE
jgi:hypothetical protein